MELASGAILEGLGEAVGANGSTAILFSSRASKNCICTI